MSDSDKISKACAILDAIILGARNGDEAGEPLDSLDFIDICENLKTFLSGEEDDEACFILPTKAVSCGHIWNEPWLAEDILTGAMARFDSCSCVPIASLPADEIKRLKQRGILK